MEEKVVNGALASAQRVPQRVERLQTPCVEGEESQPVCAELQRQPERQTNPERVRTGVLAPPALCSQHLTADLHVSDHTAGV